MASLPDSALHLWFGLEYIPGVKDVDCFLWHEEVGPFVVEVKAVSLEMVLEFGTKDCRIRGRDERRTPQAQAYEAFESLQRYLRPKVGALPFIGSTVCWPQIRREAWRRRWDNPYIAGEMADRMLFEEDIFGSPSDLTDRLGYIWKNPPHKSGAAYKFTHWPTQFDAIKAALDERALPKPAPSDLDRLRAIEKEITADTRRLVPPIGPSATHFLGFPGTGKTFRLLQVGAYHAREKRDVLFTCYNKTLAADIRRILSYSDKLGGTESGALDIYDAYDLLRSYAVELGLKDSDLDIAEWGETIAEAVLGAADCARQYDTVLIDEAQDMTDWMLRFLAAHTHPGSTVCVASGRGQELYGSGATWLHDFARNAAAGKRSIGLRRNFRNYRAVFQFAHVFHEAGMDAGKVDRLMERFRKPPRAEDPEFPEFAREGGAKPAIHRIDESDLDEIDGDSTDFPHLQATCRQKEYKRIIAGQLDRLQQDERPLDLLVLVPTTDGKEAGYAREALRQIADERPSTGYIDYTRDGNRRDTAQPHMVRLCTFHSSRGIEGHRVVVFGLENLLGLAKATEADPANLGYVVLSRSLFESAIVLRPRPTPARPTSCVPPRSGSRLGPPTRNSH